MCRAEPPYKNIVVPYYSPQNELLDFHNNAICDYNAISILVVTSVRVILTGEGNLKKCLS